MRILDRYILKNCLVPFLYCFAGFLAIWLVFDLSDNGQDFIEARVSPKQVAYYYGTQFPQIMVLSLPIGLLLALLYSLSRMSRSNELISMLSAGVSVTRLLAPLMVLGLGATAFSMFLNYRLAPHSEAVKEAVFEMITKGEEKGANLRAHLFRDRRNRRTWFIGRMSLDSRSMKDLHIMQQDEEGNVTRKTYARRASYAADPPAWTFVDGKTVDLDLEGDIVAEEYWEKKVVSDWTETPERITSSVVHAQNLSVDELRDYLRFNSDFPAAQLAAYQTQLMYRWSLPWSCFIVVFIAAPLGIVFSRRGVLAGVASSIFLFFVMLFLTYFFLALGKGARVPPIVAAWGPNILFGLIGMVLLHYRSTNREFPGVVLWRSITSPRPVARVPKG